MPTKIAQLQISQSPAKTLLRFKVGFYQKNLFIFLGQTATKPRAVNATGVSDLISIFQNEYDALMMEAHNLKQNLDSVRQELSHTLYQHDAACRVIARLIEERDEANA